MASLDIRLSQILSRHDPPEARACLRALSARPALAVEEEKDRRRMASANIRSLLAYDLIAAGLGLKPGAISKNGHIFSTSSLQFFGLGPLRSQWQRWQSTICRPRWIHGAADEFDDRLLVIGQLEGWFQLWDLGRRTRTQRRKELSM